MKEVPPEIKSMQFTRQMADWNAMDASSLPAQRGQSTRTALMNAQLVPCYNTRES